ncbi:MAG: recombination protein NinB [Dehalococcoidia bacterium]
MIAQVFILQPPTHPARRNCVEAIKAAPDGMIVRIEDPKRSNVLNAKMWAVLTQLEPIDWYGFKLNKEEWKDMITAVLKRQRTVPGLEGGFVVLGEHTRNMPAREIWDIIEYAYSLGASKCIQFVEPIEDIQPTGRPR